MINKFEQNLEDLAVEQLQGYKKIVGRIKVLERYPVGSGIYLSSFFEDDKLQELHKQLRNLPSYMYLNKHEQKIETAAHAYLTAYPAGTKAQLREVSNLQAVDKEDQRLLDELVQKIGRIIEVRSGTGDGIKGVIERITELQDLQQQKEEIDHILSVLREYKPQYAELLQARYIDGQSLGDVARGLHISQRTLTRWNAEALKEYGRLIR